MRRQSVPMIVKEDVAQALAEGRAVVALESSIIAQGMPYPANVETALQVEETIRRAGAVPATTAVLDGALRVGLSPAEIERLGTAKDAVKVGRRDLARALVTKAAGGTTVSATTTIAALAGIRVFATGGIGGVHRGWARHMDISADLRAMAESPVTVVCSGAKAFLDLPATLELLESLSVCVIGYRTSVFPSFYSRDTDLVLEHRVDDVADIAAQMAYQDALGLREGILVVNPVPEEHEVPRAVIDAAIEQALRDAEARGIVGKAVTPFVLARIKDITGGDSLKANTALVINNARLAAEIAVAYAELVRRNG
nr:pseudouridine-5-phosphate glycosidase [Bacillota bacterium]